MNLRHIRDHAKRIVAAATMACMLVAPAPAIAAEAQTGAPALEAQASNVSIARASTYLNPTSYSYTGSEIRPEPRVYMTLHDAFDYGWFGATYTPAYYDVYFDDYYDDYGYDPYYYYDRDYLNASYWDQDFDIYDFFDIVDTLDSLDTLFADSYYNLDRAYFDWLYDSHVIIDPTDSRGYVYVLDKGTDYTLSYSNNINPGTATITIRGVGDFSGTLERTFTITGSGGGGSSALDPMVSRLAGATRYDTMATIANAGFNRPCNYAIVATGSNYPDALAASSLAGAYQAPVLLTDGGTLSAQASQTLTSLGVTYVFLMGGTSAISQGVQDAIAAKGITVNRISGSDRIATSVQVMNATYQAGSSSDTVIVATGYQFADALSIGPWSYSSKSPIVLAQSNGLLSAEAVNAIKTNLRISRVIIVGGTAAVSNAVEQQLGSGYTITRLQGNTRYETSAAIADWTCGNDAAYSWNWSLVATGQNFPDALAGAALAGKVGSPLLLAHAATDATVNTMRTHRASISNFYVLGGEAAVPTSLANAIANAVR